MNKSELIQNLIDDITPLHLEKIRLETKIIFDRETYFKTFDDAKKQEIINTESELAEVQKKLIPLEQMLKKMQTTYLVEYRGKFYNPKTESHYFQTFIEELNFKTVCEIDTFSNGWEDYKSIENINDLLKEIHHFLLMGRFTKFDILNIRKLI